MFESLFSVMSTIDVEELIRSQSILSHIPRHNDFSRIKLYILIYAPDLKESALDGTFSNLPPNSPSSSFSNICSHEVRNPGEGAKSPL